ncbi:PQQ-dependent sugar dehydrogenase [uncultured Serinicoccus sp.]|uniref:PQQ-dependent sugar dehydrogenase n=1 Tax=uncultured Serinicoccus sp. TaxID=735514 RepID=UPI00260CE7E0|nr:PQQ-dependent sugar dehydrogenase [uncultured Serinicoccus sp.]
MGRHAVRGRGPLLVAAVSLVLAGCWSGADGGAPAGDDGQAGSGQGSAAEGGSSGGDADAEGVPTLDVEVVAEGLALPWDVQLLPDGTPLVTERGGRLLALEDGQVREVAIDLPDLFVGSESGLMGMALSPEGDTAYLCHATQSGGQPQDVRVTRWTLDDGATGASADGVVVDGMPITSGRHGGCRLLLEDDTLYVGTGDAADETNPQSLDSLGGKVLAVTPEGEPLADAPFVDGDPRILTYGHRNVQGLAAQPGSGTIWSVEHGSSVDDEVNVLEPGANYGWAPGPGYDESVPMTDTDRFPEAVEAAWSSGDRTHATSGAAFLEGEQWGAWEGALAVAELKDSGVGVLRVDGEEVVGEDRMAELEGDYGRLRSLTLDDDGALWVTTSNGEGDVVLRVTPRPAPDTR